MPKMNHKTQKKKNKQLGGKEKKDQNISNFRHRQIYMWMSSIEHSKVE